MQKKYIFLGLAIAMVCLKSGCASRMKTIPPVEPGSTLRIATFNIHYLQLNEDGFKDWNGRKAAVGAMFGELNADIIAVQEMQSWGRGQSRNQNIQLDYVLNNYPDYSAAAFSDDADTYPITQPILYKTDKFDFVDQGFFYFSDIPEVIYSRTYDGGFSAYCSWAEMKEKSSGKVFYVFNMHTDYASKSNREKSAALMAERIAPRIAAGASVFLVGDLNASAGSKPADLLKAAGLSVVPPEGSTFHFNRGINLTPAIDHIFYTNDIRPVSDAMVVRKKYGGKWPADHYPVAVDFKFSGGR